MVRRNLLSLSAVFMVVVTMMGCGVPLFAEPVDRNKKVYQMDYGTMPPGNAWIFGKWSERTLEPRKLTPGERAQIEAEHTAAMYRRAAYFSWLIAGLACVASYLLKNREGVGVALMAAGFSFASSIMAQSVHYALRIGACLGIVVLVGICFYLNEKGLFEIPNIKTILKKKDKADDHRSP